MKIFTPHHIYSGVGKYAYMIKSSIPGSRLVLYNIKPEEPQYGADEVITSRFMKPKVIYDFFFGGELTRAVKRESSVIFATPDFFHTAKFTRALGVIHDIFPVKNGEVYRDLPFYYREYFKREMNNVKDLMIVVTQSRYTKSEVEDYTKSYHDINIVYPAVLFNADDVFSVPKQRAKEMIMEGLSEDPKKYLLVNIATEHRRKCLDRIDRLRGLFRDAVIVTVGNSHGNKIYTGYDYRSLAFLIRGADAYISTSCDEGFDIPVIEAVYLGTPAIISSIPAHMEIERMQTGVYLFDRIEEVIDLVKHDLKVGPLHEEFTMKTFSARMNNLVRKLD